MLDAVCHEGGGVVWSPKVTGEKPLLRMLLVECSSLVDRDQILINIPVLNLHLLKLAVFVLVQRRIRDALG